jgi:hypothetical protein
MEVECEELLLPLNVSAPCSTAAQYSSLLRALRFRSELCPSAAEEEEVEEVEEEEEVEEDEERPRFADDISDVVLLLFMCCGV